MPRLFKALRGISRAASTSMGTMPSRPDKVFQAPRTGNKIVRRRIAKHEGHFIFEREREQYISK